MKGYWIMVCVLVLLGFVGELSDFCFEEDNDGWIATTQ
jgi:hypothetical protein